MTSLSPPLAAFKVQQLKKKGKLTFLQAVVQHSVGMLG